jgi:chromosome segregation ATPase
MDEVGALKSEKGQLQHDYRQQGLMVNQLRSDITQQQQQHRLDEILLQRQLKEWKERAETFQSQLQQERRNSQEVRLSQRRERREWSRQVEALETKLKENEELMKKERQQLNHERRLHQMNVETMGSRLEELSLASTKVGDDARCADNDERSLPPVSESTQSTQASTPKVDNAHEVRVLKRKIHNLERDLKSSKDSEAFLHKQVALYKSKTEAAEDASAKAADRIQVLQTFLENTVEGTTLQRLEVKQDSEAFKQKESARDRATSLQRRSEDDDNDSVSVSTPAAKDLYSRIQEETSRHSMRSRARLLKMKEMDDLSENASVTSWTGQSITSIQFDLDQPPPAVVHDMQQKLDSEMVQLKKRKEKLKRSSATSAELNESVRKYRSLLPVVNDETTAKSEARNDLQSRVLPLGSAETEVTPAENSRTIKLQGVSLEIQERSVTRSANAPSSHDHNVFYSDQKQLFPRQETKSKPKCSSREPQPEIDVLKKEIKECKLELENARREKGEVASQLIAAESGLANSMKGKDEQIAELKFQIHLLEEQLSEAEKELSALTYKQSDQKLGEQMLDVDEFVGPQ